MIRFFRKLFKRGDFMTRADKAYYKYRAKTIFWSAFCLIIIAWVGTNLVLCALTTNVESNFDMIYEAAEPATLPSGKEFDCILRNKEESNIGTSPDYTIKSIVFDKFTNKEVDVYKDAAGNNLIAGAEKTTLNVDDEIYLYRANSGANVYVLSNRAMYANADSSYMFYGLSSCETATFNNFKTDNVTNMTYMFGGGLNPGGPWVGNSTQGLQSLDLSGWNTSKVTDMSYMFYACPKLTSLNMLGWDTKNVITMASMFMDTSWSEREFSELDLSSFDTRNVTDMGNMFYGDFGDFGGADNMLTTIYVSDRFVVDQVESSSWMFYCCNNLVGGKGTTHDENHIDKEYARIDGGPNSATPGYFTERPYSGK